VVDIVRSPFISADRSQHATAAGHGSGARAPRHEWRLAGEPHPREGAETDDGERADENLPERRRRRPPAAAHVRTGCRGEQITLAPRARVALKMIALDLARRQPLAE